MGRSDGSPGRGSLLGVSRQAPEWLPVSVSDWRLRALRDRHYAGGVGGLTVGPPARRIAFVTFEGTAGWVSSWPDPRFVDHGFGDAFTCTLFRKECPGLASEMIEDAIRRTELRWGSPPPGGWLTFVDPAEVASPNPGYCFKRSGFVVVGRTAGGHGRPSLVVLRRGDSLAGRGVNAGHQATLCGRSV